MVRAWPNTLLALTGALGLAQMGQNGKILVKKSAKNREKKKEIIPTAYQLVCPVIWRHTLCRAYGD